MKGENTMTLFTINETMFNRNCAIGRGFIGMRNFNSNGVTNVFSY